ncbi:acyl-CoA thioesterase/bile acid-CoA:amino acid N-acyltransferase family protein [Heyndrickxia camelliae]|nr:acyl-CoA thioesterase/bile acid-CoA:amino acid N-acyltransferase family protein [Heyndrickxia camelliae]
MPLIEVAPRDDLFDSEINIRISNLLSKAKISIKANMMDQFGYDWESFASFRANEAGCIDIKNQTPFEGTYKSADGMGLFWSMKRVHKAEGISDSSLAPRFLGLDFYVDDQLIKTFTLKRRFIGKNVVRKEIRQNGLVGTYFYPVDGIKRQAIIYLGGSEGGLMERKPALLASHGFAVLGLAYFGKEQLPSELIEIPLEYLQTAIKWLLSQAEVDERKGIKLIGISKGGELALLAASMFYEVSGVVGIVPSSVIYPGLGSKFSSSWSYKGNPIPFLDKQIPEHILDENHRKHMQAIPIQYRNFYRARLSQIVEKQDAIIPVERIKGDVLIISGEDDQLWPSDIHGDMIMERLRKASFPYGFEHLKYRGAGHSFYIPHWPTANCTVGGYGQIKMDLGGNPEKAAFAQSDSWQKILSFLVQ